MPVVADTDLETTLSALLRSETQAVHTRAERSGIVRDLLRGTIGREGYLLYLRSLLPAYLALETGLEARRAESSVAAFAQPALYRTEAIEADLAAIGGRDWRGKVAPAPSAAAYAEHIEAAAREASGAALVAHAYVRYFGDLSGGQILRRILAKALQFPDSALAFYDFPTITDIEASKVALRHALDDLGRSCGAARGLVVAEAVSGFLANIAISEEVQQRIGAAPFSAA